HRRASETTAAIHMHLPRKRCRWHFGTASNGISGICRMARRLQIRPLDKDSLRALLTLSLSPWSLRFTRVSACPFRKKNMEQDTQQSQLDELFMICSYADIPQRRSGHGQSHQRNSQANQGLEDQHD